MNFDGTENLFIEGDNLEVLKLLQKSYYGKVKMIYIDPPYNTGNEFIYPDNYSESLDTYLSYAGLVDDEGKKFTTNTATEGRFHTKWLNMMYPRLYLARNLLREDGVIFISIDEHEITSLKILCNEIFGEENFVACVVWERAFSPKNDSKYFSESHDYILVYSKQIGHFNIGKLERTAEANSRYNNPDNDPRGNWMSSDLSVKTYSAEYNYPITTPSWRIVKPTHGRCWIVSKKRFSELVLDDRIWFGVSGDNAPRLKRFLSEVNDGMVPTTLWTHSDVGHNQEGRQELKSLFDGKGYFDSPKPERLIRRVLEVANVSREDIILDFFAGSATTAHAVLELNKEDGGNRKFIMVQLPEPCDEKSEAYQACYKTIADIGKERIRRVIKKIHDEQEAKKQENESALPGMAQENQELDLGFRVLKLDKSNFKVWDGTDPNMSVDQLKQQLELHLDHINHSSSQEDILFEILIKAGYVPTERVDTITLADKTVFSISNGALLVCLEDEITQEVIDEMAKAEPKQVICLDQVFNQNDQLKTNAVQTFATLNQGRETSEQIIFRTV